MCRMRKPEILEFSKDYSISLLENNHEKIKIKLANYNNTQMIDEREIKCSKCSTSKAETFQGNFYYCFQCKQNFCPLCKSLHKEHKNIVDFSLKYFKCSEHQDQNFISYCFNCKKNLCIICGNQHKDHKATYFDESFFEVNQEFKERIQKLKELVDNIINSLQKFKENLDIYVQINEELNEKLLNMKLNYENLKSMKNLMEISFLKEDIDQILNNSDSNKRFQKIISIYDIMNGKVTSISNNYESENKKNKEELKLSDVNNFNKSENKKNKEEVKSSDVNNFNKSENKKNKEEVKSSDVNNFNKSENKKSKEEVKSSDISKVSEIKMKKSKEEVKLSDINNINKSENKKSKEEAKSSDISKVSEIKMKKSSEIYNEITIKLKIERRDINKIIYFLDNTQKNDGKYREKYNWVFHNHDNLSELNESNTILFINGILEPFKKYFNPKKSGTYSIKLQFENKLSDCSYMFCHCSNIIQIDFSKFKTENVNNMSYMFCDCSLLKSLDLRSFNTENVSNMISMFSKCSSLKSLYLRSFKTENTSNMCCMFYNCKLLTSLDLRSFNTQNVLIMEGMFANCTSLTTINLSSFNLKNDVSTDGIFDGCGKLSNKTIKDFHLKEAAIKGEKEEEYEEEEEFENEEEEEDFGYEKKKWGW